MIATNRTTSARFIAALLALLMAVFPAVALAAGHSCGGSDEGVSSDMKPSCCARDGQSQSNSEDSDSDNHCGAGCLSMCCRAAVAVTYVTFDFAHDAPPAAPVIQPELAPHTAETAGGIFHPPRL